ncbi:hypothetical protein [Flavobacterium sp.]|uniref:hypothetical protein n=1 Tax=Flavobacterium sp. TaxID=239 RepID=UPI004033CDCC
MSKTAKALLYNFLGFLPFFLLLSYLIQEFTGLTGFWIPFTAAVATTILAPKFQAIKVQGEHKIFMKWLFIKGVKEVK